MITGDNTVKIKRYLLIDRNAEGLCWVEPDEGQEFIGWPYGYAGDYAAPFIAVVQGKKTIKTINALDCSAIEFL